jgi:hypothetical protein
MYVANGAFAASDSSVGIARDPDLAQAVARVGHRPEQRQPVREGARLGRVAADHERLDDAGVAQPRQQRAQVALVANHPRRQVRDSVEATALQSRR